MKQRQFLDVVSDEEARRRVLDATAALAPRAETVALEEAWGRVLFEELRAAVDVPGFDRSDVDGFALRAEDVYGATETDSRRLRLREEAVHAGAAAGETRALEPGEAAAIATGGVLPRGADAVVMVEDTAPARDEAATIEVFRSVAPGAHVTGAGTDLGRGDVVLRPGVRLGSRETALIAAVGVPEVRVFRRPRVAVLSTGDEVVPPGRPLAVGEIHDSNGRVLADAVRECGGEPVALGIAADRVEDLRARIVPALEGAAAADLILLSGGTSKGAGDLAHRVVAELAAERPGSPGIVVHGVALKPGKPFCLAVVGTTPVAVLPGFPTSAIFTFHEFVAPVIRRLAGLSEGREEETVEAVAPMRLPSALGRTEYMLVDLVPGPAGLAAYPLGRGSGSVSTFSVADGFVRIDRHTERVEEGARLRVHPLGERVEPADLVAIGSHCIGLDLLLGLLAERGFRVKSIPVGSRGGLRALERGEGDVAGCHLLDELSGRWNLPFLPEGTAVLGGYGRRQGIVHRPGEAAFDGLAPEEAVRRVRGEDLVMVNRNPGSGTRILLDGLLAGSRPRGYHAQARSHHAVAAAVAQGRADWGVTLERLARDQGLAFLPLRDERYDLVARSDRLERPALTALRALLADPAIRERLRELGLDA